MRGVPAIVSSPRGLVTTRRAFLGGVCAAALVARGRDALASSTPTFGLVLHRPSVADESHGFLHEVARAVGLARDICLPLGFDLAVDAVSALDSTHHRIESVGMRDALSPLVRPRRINVFLVEALRDSESKTVYRNGVTWDARVAPVHRYIILARGAWESSLAHELGHFFGIPEHSAQKNNLMSYDREDDLVFLDDGQKARIRAGAARLLASKAQDDLSSKA